MFDEYLVQNSQPISICNVYINAFGKQLLNFVHFGVTAGCMKLYIDWELHPFG